MPTDNNKLKKFTPVRLQQVGKVYTSSGSSHQLGYNKLKKFTPVDYNKLIKFTPVRQQVEKVHTS